MEYALSMYRDDEDEGLARPEDQYRSDKKEVRQKRAAESKGKLLDLQRAVLRTSVGKDKVKPEANRKDEEDKKDEKDTTPPETFGTKTHAQQEKQAVQTASEKSNNEQMIEQQKKQDAAKQQAGEEYQSDAG
ncbi:MAG: hypothetical protein Greene041662_784 [Candidatus Peregrinibacteria bacterium Greene0416_62]|nr:MAG: hypothetical protein Greene041662_784 [Candidatus Peregrinibacteria bacterium Greene0416_62]TSC98998.1 MAG: hypothetical protein Greene101449_747 [Candidatus Peregrinibacteria bacterium Greene1014_49]